MIDKISPRFGQSRHFGYYCRQGSEGFAHGVVGLGCQIPKTTTPLLWPQNHRTIGLT